MNITDDGLSRLACDSCQKSVSTRFLPVPTETPDRGLIVRAYIECPECIEKRDPARYQQQPPPAEGTHGPHS